MIMENLNFVLADELSLGQEMKSGVAIWETRDGLRYPSFCSINIWVVNNIPNQKLIAFAEWNDWSAKLLQLFNEQMETRRRVFYLTNGIIVVVNGKSYTAYRNEEAEEKDHFFAKGSHNGTQEQFEKMLEADLKEFESYE